MAGVFELIRGPQKRPVGYHGMVQRADPRALELQAAIGDSGGGLQSSAL